MIREAGKRRPESGDRRQETGTGTQWNRGLARWPLGKWPKGKPEGGIKWHRHPADGSTDIIGKMPMPLREATAGGGIRRCRFDAAFFSPRQADPPSQSGGLTPLWISTTRGDPPRRTGCSPSRNSCFGGRPLPAAACRMPSAPCSQLHAPCSLLLKLTSLKLPGGFALLCQTFGRISPAGIPC
jgi:hypothetical protein